MANRTPLIIGLVLFIASLATLVIGVLAVLSFRIFEGFVLLGTSTAFAKIAVDAVNGYIAAKVLNKDQQ
ncbi:MAG: hypothetical protein PWP76_53 [Candidatus Diapherotrites archaeon]|nr:hypothetical protein [Candidatus Diapherotrites archaeon]MDN5366917.1 hypothetical protein [Candidatus Diapherotrites archaeon]